MNIFFSSALAISDCQRPFHMPDADVLGKHAIFETALLMFISIKFCERRTSATFQPEKFRNRVYCFSECVSVSVCFLCGVLHGIVLENLNGGLDQKIEWQPNLSHTHGYNYVIVQEILCRKISKITVNRPRKT